MNELRIVVSGPTSSGKTHLIDKVLTKALREAGYSFTYFDEGHLVATCLNDGATHQVKIVTACRHPTLADETHDHITHG